MSGDWYDLGPSGANRAHIKREREKAQKLKKSNWWNQILQCGECHYCQKKFDRSELTMDHVVPLARGGCSTQGNIVAACRSCNENKKLKTPVESLLDNLTASRPDNGDNEGDGV